MAGLWKRKAIDALEASLYRKVLLLQNGISIRAILNTMTSIRPAGAAISQLDYQAREEAER